MFRLILILLVCIASPFLVAQQAIASNLPKCSGSPPIFMPLSKQSYCSKAGWNNCVGKVTLPGWNGLRYEGIWKNGRLSSGSITYNRSDKYKNTVTGPWRNKCSLIDGENYVVNYARPGVRNGRKTYKGQLNKKGQYHGKGQLTFANETIQDGYFENGNYVGKKNVSARSTLEAAFESKSVTERKLMQETLGELGFYKSAIDGLFGSSTQNALRAYNKKYFNNSDLNSSPKAFALVTALLQTVSGKVELKPEPKIVTAPKVELKPVLELDTTPKSIETVKASNCENNPTRCLVGELCQRATSFETGALGWTATIIGAPYVQFAKNSGVTCGIRDDVVAAVPEQTQIEPLTPKKVLKYKNRKVLVIGNASYVDQTPLKNPINDARAVAAKLQEIGFEVTYKEDLKVREFGRALGSFERTLSNSDISLIYYAGHGIEVDGENYLIPVDAELRNASDVKFETVMLQDAVSASLNTGKLSMVLIDACRDNPFVKSMKGKNRSIGRGLSVVDAQRSKVDQIISFAAESGEFAEDGNGDNSPYATALIDLLDEPNLEVGKLFRKLGDSVESMTKGKQIPVTRNRLSGEDIFFVVE